MRILRGLSPVPFIPHPTPQGFGACVPATWQRKGKGQPVLSPMSWRRGECRISSAYLHLSLSCYLSHTPVRARPKTTFSLLPHFLLSLVSRIHPVSSWVLSFSRAACGGQSQQPGWWSSYSFLRAAETNRHRLGSLKQQKCIPAQL